MPGETALLFTVYLHGIGNSGDTVNPNANELSNKTPLTTQRPFNVKVGGQTITGTLIYDNGVYTGMIPLGTNFTTGTYDINLGTNSFLAKNMSGIQITKGNQPIIPEVTLVAGDVNGDGTLDSLDYNLIIGCYSEDDPAESCTDEQKILADLNDDGNVNQYDYNLFLREISVN